MSTLELDLSDIRNISCAVYGFGSTYASVSSDLTNILRQYESIPVTLRYLIQYWEMEDRIDKKNEMAELDRLIDGKRPAANPMTRDAVDSGQSVQSASVDNTADSCDGEGKVLKKRRIDDYDTGKRSETSAKDDKKESSSRSTSKESECYSVDYNATNTTQKSIQYEFEYFRSPIDHPLGKSASISSAASRLIDQLTDTGSHKSSESSSHHSKTSGSSEDGKRSFKSNTDCDKTKSLRIESESGTKQKVDTGDLKRKQKRPRDDKSDHSSSVSISPIITALATA